jgi:hypothetical protein
MGLTSHDHAPEKKHPGTSVTMTAKLLEAMPFSFQAD